MVSILVGGREAGEHLVRHHDVDKIAFTGSSAVGRRIAGICGERLARCSLELGGKSAAIVLDDADLGRTAEGLKFASFLNSGQACVAQTRVLAPRHRYAETVDALAAMVDALAVGDPGDAATYVGPLVAQRQQERVLGYLRQAETEGARTVVGGTEPPPDAGGAGWYVAPTLLADVDNAMTVAQEEIFGPVVCVIPYENEEDAVRIANDSPFGLAGSVWSKDRGHAGNWRAVCAPAWWASTASLPTSGRRSVGTSRAASAGSMALSAWTGTSSTSRSTAHDHAIRHRRLGPPVPRIQGARSPVGSR